jgi:DNA-binding response OmpR family regulator
MRCHTGTGRRLLPPLQERNDTISKEGRSRKGRPITAPANDRVLDALSTSGAALKQETSPKRHPKSILLVDDDTGLCSLMAEFFETHNFHLDAAHDGGTGLAMAIEGNYSMVLLDVMLPVCDGFQVLTQLRRRSAVPVILLTARSDQQDRVAGLEAGADDYLPKPFGPQELLARVRAVLRRTEQIQAGSPILEVGEIRLNNQTRTVSKRDRPVDLTSFEFDVLDALMRSAGRVISRDEIAATLYHRESTPFERSIDVHVSHLRKKLETNDEVLIRTVRGVGYLFVSEMEQPK